MTMWYAYLVPVILGLAQVGLTQDESVFIIPTAPGPSNNFLANMEWALGSVQTIQWTTDLQSYYIALFQQSVDPPSGTQIETIFSVSRNGSGDKSFDWKVQTYDSNLTFSVVYFFWVNPGSASGFTSHYFNITNQQDKSTSSASASSTSSSVSSATASPSKDVTAATVSAAASSELTTAGPSTSSPTAVVSSSAAATSATAVGTASEAASENDSKSNSGVLKVALGVGLGLGVPLVLIAGIWIGLTAVKQRRSSARSVESSLPLSHLYSDQKSHPEPPPPIHTNEPVYRSYEIYEAPVPHQSPVELGSYR